MYKLIFTILFLKITPSFATTDVVGGVKTCFEIMDAIQRITCYDSLARGILSVSNKDGGSEKILNAAKEPIKALRRLQSRVQTGISYREYPSAVSDAKYEIDAYSREYSDKTPEYSKHLNNALIKYSDAIKAWNYKFEGRGVENLIWMPGVVNAFKNKYPELNAAETTGGLRIDSVLQILWNLAGRDIESAQTEFSILSKK